jgi:hypothetical protein
VVEVIAYGCCVGDWDRFRRYIVPATQGRPLVALSGQTSIASAYNTILEAYRGKDVEAVILLHDDLEITDPLAEEKILKALAEPDVALVGVAGGKGRDSLQWWNSETIGHQMTDSGPVDFGQRAGDVAFLEGSVVAFSPWAVDWLQCDTDYTDFRSGWDDVCLTAVDAGMRNVVVDMDTRHHTTIGWKSPEIKAKFMESEAIFREKWGIQ